MDGWMDVANCNQVRRRALKYLASTMVGMQVLATAIATAQRSATHEIPTDDGNVQGAFYIITCFCVELA
jgi:hypothetical protein